MKQNRGVADVPATSFIEEFGAELKAKCLQNEPPFCEVVCPFRLPVREMEEKWEKGRFNAVYRTYQTKVLFPAIVSELCSCPCEDACILKNRGGSLALKDLEKATVKLARRTSPNAYNLPPKPQRVAVIGAGLAGLGCALRLLNKKYSVTVYDAGSVPGGTARSQMDPERFDEEIRRQFSEEHPDFRLHTPVSELAPIEQEFDAVLIATGKEGSTFGRCASESGAFATDHAGTFLAGECAGAEDPVIALSQGIRAALAVERYLKTGLMNEPADTADTRLMIDEKRIPVQERVTPAKEAEGYDAEEAAKEAARCQKCSCDICRKECDLMRIQEKSAGRLYEEVYITVRPSTLANDGRWATRRIASCDQCGLCRDICPQRIDMGAFLMQSHRALKDSDAMPWAFHDFWLRDMEFSVTEASALIRRDASKAVSFAFFPGCQLGGSDPESLKKIAEYVLGQDPQAAVWLNCCGAPAVWSAEKERQEAHIQDLRTMWETMGCPTVVFACPTCRKMFDRYLPEIPGIFLEEWILTRGLPESAPWCEGKLAIFDPCASRPYPELQKAVRRICEEMGIETEELSHSGDQALCCSYGGQTAIAAPDYVRRVRMERATESPLPYLTYCINCRDSFASRGKENIHLLSLIFGDTDLRRPIPTWTKRRDNRRMVKELLTHAAGKEEECMKIRCTEELQQKLSDQYILMEDMAGVIEACEAKGTGILYEDGSITGYKRSGHMTYWATYRNVGEGEYELLNGYAHRMNLEGE